MYPHLVVLALVLEGFGAAVGRGLAFLSGAGHPEANRGMRSSLKHYILGSYHFKPKDYEKLNREIFEMYWTLSSR